MQQLRDELEQKNSEDKAKLLRELDTLRQLNLSTPTSDYQDEMENGLRKNTAYDLLQSIAHTPIQEVPSIENRIVIGKESRRMHSPDCASSYQSSIISSCGSSPEEHRRRHFSIEQEHIDEETLDISFVDKSRAGEKENEEEEEEKNTGGSIGDHEVDGASVGGVSEDVDNQGIFTE